MTAISKIEYNTYTEQLRNFLNHMKPVIERDLDISATLGRITTLPHLRNIFFIWASRMGRIITEDGTGGEFDISGLEVYFDVKGKDNITMNMMDIVFLSMLSEPIATVDKKIQRRLANELRGLLRISDMEQKNYSIK